MPRRLLAVLVTALAAGCGSSPAGPSPCREGATERCLCEDGEGVRACAAGVWGACVCGETESVLDLSALPEDPTGRADRLLDLGEVAVGARAERDLLVRNGGTRRLVVRVEAPSPPFAVEPDGLAIVPGGRDALRVSVVLPALGESDRFVTLRGGGETARVRLHATGVTTGVRCVGRTPGFATVGPGGWTTAAAATCINDGGLDEVLAEIRGGDGAFSVEPGHAIAAGGRIEIRVTFAPVSPGNFEAELVLRNGSGLLEIVDLRGRAAFEVVRFSPPVLPFGQLAPGESRELPLEVRNVLDEPVEVTGISVSSPRADAFLVGDHRGPIPAGGTIVVPVRFEPGYEGVFHGQLLFEFDRGQEAVSISGGCGGPILRCDPSVDVGFTSLAVPRRARFGCRNVGTDLTGHERAVVDRLWVSSSELEARLVDRTPPVALAPGEAVELEVTFRPDSPGLFWEGAVDVVDATTGRSESVAVTGWGLDLPPTCAWQTVPPNLDLGVVEPPRTIELAIPAGGCLPYDARPEPACAEALEVSPLRQGLVDGGVETRLTATVRETARCDVVFTVADVDEPERRLGVRASVGEACVELAPRDLDFGTTGPGCVVGPRTVTVTNRCAGPRRLVEAQLEEALGFALEPWAPATLDPGGTATLAVRYAPVAAGSHVGALVVEVEGSAPYRVNVQGQADPALACEAP